jgi:hypothetical protein
MCTTGVCLSTRRDATGEGGGVAIFDIQAANGVDRGRLGYRRLRRELRLPIDGNHCCHLLPGETSAGLHWRCPRSQKRGKILLTEGPHSQIAEDP